MTLQNASSKCQSFVLLALGPKSSTPTAVPRDCETQVSELGSRYPSTTLFFLCTLNPKPIKTKSAFVFLWVACMLRVSALRLTFTGLLLRNLN